MAAGLLTVQPKVNHLLVSIAYTCVNLTTKAKVRGSRCLFEVKGQLFGKH